MSVSSNHRRPEEAAEDKELSPPPGAHNGNSGNHKEPASERTRTPAGQPTDEQLLAKYRQGDKPAFSQLVERYHRELFHFLVRFLGDRAAA